MSGHDDEKIMIKKKTKIQNKTAVGAHSLQTVDKLVSPGQSSSRIAPRTKKTSRMSLTTVQEGHGRHDHIQPLALPVIRLRLNTRHVRSGGHISRDIGVHLSLHTYDESKDDCKGSRERFGTSCVRVNLNTTYLDLHNHIARAAFRTFAVRPRDFPYGSSPGASFGKISVDLEDGGIVSVNEENWEYLRRLLVDDDETAHFETWIVVVPPMMTDEQRRKMAREKAMGTGGPKPQFRRMTVPNVQGLPSESSGSGLLGWFKRVRVDSMP